MMEPLVAERERLRERRELLEQRVQELECQEVELLRAGKDRELETVRCDLAKRQADLRGLQNLDVQIAEEIREGARAEIDAARLQADCVRADIERRTKAAEEAAAGHLGQAIATLLPVTVPPVEATCKERDVAGAIRDGRWGVWPSLLQRVLLSNREIVAHSIEAKMGRKTWMDVFALGDLNLERKRHEKAGNRSIDQILEGVNDHV